MDTSNNPRAVFGVRTSSDEDLTREFALNAQHAAEPFIRTNTFSHQRAAELMHNPSSASTDAERAYVKTLRELYQQMFNTSDTRSTEARPQSSKEGPVSSLAEEMERQRNRARRDPSLFENPRNNSGPSEPNPRENASTPQHPRPLAQVPSDPSKEGAESRNLGQVYPIILSALYEDGLISAGEPSLASQQAWPYTNLDVATIFHVEGDEVGKELLDLHREYVIRTLIIPCMQLLGITGVSYTPATSSVELNRAGEISVQVRPVEPNAAKLLEWYVKNLIYGTKLQCHLPREFFPEPESDGERIPSGLAGVATHL